MNSRWFLEETTPHEGSFHSLIEILYSGQSSYQKIEVIVTGSYGKSLVLDGKIQSTEVDEFIYHEALVHPAMTMFDEPKRVLIAGGGEGPTARESLRYPSVEKVDIVDLDQEVVEVSKIHLSSWHEGALTHPKVNIYYQDAREFIENVSEPYDLVIADLPEPFEEGTAMMLYTKEFFEAVYRALNDRGVFVTQATGASANNYRVFTAIAATLKQVFPVVRPYMVNVPSFHMPWGFVNASKAIDPCFMSSEVIDKKLSPFKDKLRYYDGSLHNSLFCLPKYLKDALEREDVIIKDSSPLSFY